MENCTENGIEKGKYRNAEILKCKNTKVQSRNRKIEEIQCFKPSI